MQWWGVGIRGDDRRGKIVSIKGGGGDNIPMNCYLNSYINICSHNSCIVLIERGSVVSHSSLLIYLSQKIWFVALSLICTCFVIYDFMRFID